MIRRLKKFFKGTLDRCPECNVLYIENDGWCRGCGEKRRKRSLVLRVAAFNVLLGAMLLLSLFVCWLLISQFAPELAAKIFDSNNFYFMIWLEGGIVCLWSLMPLAFFSAIIEFIRGK